MLSIDVRQFSWYLGSGFGMPLPDQSVVAYLVTAGVTGAARTRVVNRLPGIVDFKRGEDCTSIQCLVKL
jgi:hypothetical protein